MYLQMTKKKTLTLLFLWWDVETHGSLPRFSPRQMLFPAQLWTCATRKNKYIELICFPTSNEQSSINPAIIRTVKQKLAWNATMEPHADAWKSLCWDIWATFLHSLRLTSCHVVFKAQYITKFCTIRFDINQFQGFLFVFSVRPGKSLEVL